MTDDTLGERLIRFEIGGNGDCMFRALWMGHHLLSHNLLPIYEDHNTLVAKALFCRQGLMQYVRENPANYIHADPNGARQRNETPFQAWAREMEGAFHEGDQYILRANKDRNGEGYMVYHLVPGQPRHVAWKDYTSDLATKNIRLLHYNYVQNGVLVGLHWEFMITEEEMNQRLARLRSSNLARYQVVMAAELK